MYVKLWLYTHRLIQIDLDLGIEGFSGSLACCNPEGLLQKRLPSGNKHETVRSVPNIRVLTLLGSLVKMVSVCVNVDKLQMPNAC